MTSATQLQATQAIQARIAPLREALSRHPLYTAIHSEADMRLFLESHVFAVWDFMSLLKALQLRLTCTELPWRPTPYPASRRFINEIVLGEESDEYEGQPLSHFEIYLKAMQQAGADTTAIHNLLSDLDATPVEQALAKAEMPDGARAFVQGTFSLIAQGKLHCLAAAFTFGREDLIPEMFSALVADLNARGDGRWSTFLWYLQRHIEVDGEDHGPLSLKMVADLCVTPAQVEEAAQAAAEALQARTALWDAVLERINVA